MKKILLLIAPFIAFSCSYNSFEEKEVVDCTVSDLSIQVDEVINADCGVENGEITVIATGGSSPYMYVLNNGAPQSSSKFEELAASNYSIKVIDSNGCEKSIEETVQNNEGVNATIEVEESGCGDNQGSITVMASNGIEPYTYQLDNGSPQTSNVFPGLEQGEYSILVEDANGCVITLEEKVPSGVSFSTSVSTIITQNCAISGCHAGTQSPDFRQFGNIQANASNIKTRTQNGTMPKTGSLTQEQIDLIACWVDDGALDN